MKKFLLVLTLLFAVASFSAFSWGIGAAFGMDPVGGLPSNVMLSLKAPQTPLLWGIGFAAGSNQFSLGLTGDYWVANENLFSIFNYYIGPGFYLGVNNSNLQLGGRLPIGLNMFPIRNFEVFMEIAPTVTATFGDPISFPNFGMQGAFGLRFWF